MAMAQVFNPAKIDNMQTLRWFGPNDPIHFKILLKQEPLEL
jgi:hypothetical protein